MEPSAAGPNEQWFHEDVDIDETTNHVVLKASVGALYGDPIVVLTRLPAAQNAANPRQRGPVIGGISDGAAMDTADELCAFTYRRASGVTTACVQATARKYDPTNARATWLTSCTGDEVPSGTYFETVCTVE
jgi:hypothetical protein